MHRREDNPAGPPAAIAPAVWMDLAGKLQLKPGQSVAIVNAPEDAVLELADHPIATGPGEADAVIVYCTNQAELTELRDDLVSGGSPGRADLGGVPEGASARHRPVARRAGRAGASARRPARAPDCLGRRLVGVAPAPGLTSMVSTDEARRLALSLPDAVEQDHHGRPSFRVAARIFATFWDPEHMNVVLDEPGILTAVQAHPDICAEATWGKRLAAVRVTSPAADRNLLSELLADAWEGKKR